MAEKKVVKAESKKRKKRWFKIVASKQFNHCEIGETQVYTSDEVIGKTAKVNLTNLTNDMKKQHVNVTFKVNQVKDGVGYTELISYKIMPTHIKRIIRRNTEKLDDSLVLRTKDNVLVRIKPLLVTRGKVKGSVVAVIRRKARAFLNHHVKKSSYELLINDIITSRLQSGMYRFLKKVYPIKTSEIRSISIEKEKTSVAELGDKKAKKEMPEPEKKEEKQEEKPEKPKEKKEEAKKPEPEKKEEKKEETRKEQSSFVSQKPKVSVKPAEEKKAEPKQDKKNNKSD